MNKRSSEVALSPGGLLLLDFAADLAGMEKALDSATAVRIKENVAICIFFVIFFVAGTPGGCTNGAQRRGCVRTIFADTPEDVGGPEVNAAPCAKRAAFPALSDRS